MQIDIHTWRSPNHSPHTQPIRAIVLHSCDGALPNPRASSLPWLCSPQSNVSAHYYVCRDGAVFGLVDEDRIAWHAGVSLYDGIRGWNDFSIGIELEHHAGQDWPPAQLSALAALCDILISRYHIAQDKIVAHRWIAVDPHGNRGRRSDPTDWPDDMLKRWIALRYPGTDPFAGWGERFPLAVEQHGWGIPREWLKSAAQLGEAVGPETPLADGAYSVQSFEHGVVVYHRASDSARPVIFVG